MELSEIQSDVRQLASDDGLVRTKAREALVAAGGYEVTHALIALVADSRRQVRWEAVMALGQIGDPVSALPLVHALDERDKDIGYAAANGLANLGEAGLMAVLSALTREIHSAAFCELAHHALRELDQRRCHPNIIEPVLRALGEIDARLAAPVAAHDALQQLRVGAKT